MSVIPDFVKKVRAHKWGNLRPVLLEVAEALLAERGVDGFSLRETARRAGVSPAAHAYYFKDTRAILTAIAVRAFRDLGERLRQATEDAGPDRDAAIRAQARAYVTFAYSEQARFDLMWRRGVLDPEDPDFVKTANETFQQLDRIIRGEDADICKNSDPALAPSIGWWSLVHGFSMLLNEGVLGEPEMMADVMLPAMLDRFLLDEKG